MDPQVGQLINNKYRLVRLIGDGGMGSVWEARHELLGTSVALKFLHATLARRKGLVERFLQEARVSARIKSPNVVHVSDVDRTSEGLAYMVMEYIDGETLQTLYERNYQQGKRMSYGEAFTYFLQMLDGVAAAHRLGIVHRDLKPDNVMLTTDSKNRALVKLLDFGIAKLKASGEVDRGLTRPGVVMGTPEYMAPEQAFSADRVDGRADIFSLGVMFFEMLAGRRPVGGDNAHAIAAQYLEGSIAQLRELARNIDPQLAEAVHKAMAAKPEDRYQAVEQFRDAVEPYAPEGPRSRKRSSHVPKTPPAAEFDGSGPKGPELALEDTSPTSNNEDVDTRAMDSKALEDARTEDVSSGNTGDTQNDAPDAQNDAVRAGTEAMPAVPEIGESGTARMHAVPDKRPASGTVVGEPFETPAPYGATAVDGATPYAQPTPGITPTPGRRPARSGPSLLSILLIASVVSGAVVGGLYLAHRHSLQEEADNPPPKPVPTQVAPEPQTVTEPAQPDPTPPVVEPQPPPPTVQPPSKPNPNPKPQPSAQPKPEPSGPPPIIPTVIPSEFPPIPPIFPLPGQIQPQPPGTQPQPPPPAQPTSKPPRVIFRPRSTPKAAPPTQQTPEASTERPWILFKRRPKPDVETSTNGVIFRPR